MKLSNKAQDVKVSTLIVIIMGLFLLYLVFLPPEARDKLLFNETQENDEANNDKPDPSRLLLSRTPGEVASLQETTIDHPVPAIFLTSQREAKQLLFFPALSIERTFSSSSFFPLAFLVPESDRIESPYLSFTADRCRGIVTIKLNNQVVFSDRISSGTPDPIPMNPDLFQSSNVLSFELSRPFIFTKNHCRLTNVKVAADTIKTERLRASSSFVIGRSEFDYFESARLVFVPSCSQFSIGRMTVRVNNIVIYEGVPSCEALNSIEISKSMIRQGDNTIDFELSSGTARIDNMKITSRLTSPTNPLYYFQVSDDQINQLRTKKAVMKFEFPDDLSERRLVANLNGHRIDIDTRDREYTYVVTS
ncbi:MAG TPA: hypothetical protein ENN46_03265, partial [Candidatus Woesearchaeota archaeon]|nr:hypothetical protein [Candidatus Woesearchaeota archaeon]